MTYSTVLAARLSPDPRDRSSELALSTLPSLENLPDYRYWDGGGVVGGPDVTAAWIEWCRATGVQTDDNPTNLYREAQFLDSWPGQAPQRNGTDLRSAARALALRGVVGEERYLFSPEAIIRCVLGRCPVVVATDWYESFDNGESPAFMSGPVVGRHAYMIDGVSVSQWMFRIRDENKTRLPIEYMPLLLASDGEAMICLEV